MKSVIEYRRARWAWIVAALVVLGGLTGCETDPEPNPEDELNPALITTWSSTYSSYVITADDVSYLNSSGEIDFAGSIKYVDNFSETAGVLIIEYDDEYKPEYYAEYDPDTWLPVGDPLPLKGNFIGVYFKGLSADSAQIGSAYKEGGAEESTLEAAIAAFTVDNEGDYMGQYGTYSK
ncbi:MAG: hypothetical protein LBQ35_02625 [Spirochaetaceae bacterium]|jgi:hypothetical protein|nr:hypothetical protein [Spirochaetaceae bacterium]